MNQKYDNMKPIGFFLGGLGILIIGIALLIPGICTYFPVSSQKEPSQPIVWVRSIGTDVHAGKTEYLLLDGLEMEWSTASKGSGYLYKNKPLTNTAVWTFKNKNLFGKNSNAIKVVDGERIIASHKTGKSFEIKIVIQTEYYIKILYRKI